MSIDLVPEEVTHVPWSDASPMLLDHHLASLTHNEQGLNHLEIRSTEMLRPK